jgi:hypothetical protein
MVLEPEPTNNDLTGMESGLWRHDYGVALVFGEDKDKKPPSQESNSWTRHFFGKRDHKVEPVPSTPDSKKNSTKPLKIYQLVQRVFIKPIYRRICSDQLVERRGIPWTHLQPSSFHAT